MRAGYFAGSWSPPTLSHTVVFTSMPAAATHEQRTPQKSGRAMAAGAAQAAVEGQSCPLWGCGQGLPAVRHACAAEGLGWLRPGWTGTVVGVRLRPSARDPQASPPAQTAIPAGRAGSWGPTRPLVPKAGAAVAACIPPAGATSASAVMLAAVGRAAVVPAPPHPVPQSWPPLALSRALAVVSVDLCAALGAVTLPALCCWLRATGSGTVPLPSVTAAELGKPQAPALRGEPRQWEMLRPSRWRVAWPACAAACG